MKEAVTKVIDTLTQEDFHGAFEKLLERYNKCIAAGDYFEGDLSFMCDSCTLHSGRINSFILPCCSRDSTIARLPWNISRLLSHLLNVKFFVRE